MAQSKPKSVVVIGAGLGGLSAAIHSRLEGHDVLVLEQRSLAGGKAAGIVEGGYRLDPGPSIVILPRVYEAVFERAGKAMSDYLRFQRLDPTSRVLFEGQEPLDLPADPDQCIEILRDIAPADVENFKRLMGKLRSISPLIDQTVFDHPYHRGWQLADPKLIRTALPFDVRKTYKQLVDGWFQSPLLRAFFYGFPSYGGQSYHSKSIGALMIPFLMLEEGVFYPEGGVAAIPAAFELLAREIGVEFRFDASVVGFDRDDRLITAVTLSDGSRVEAESFISNVDRYTVQSWHGSPCDLAASYSYFTLHFGIQAKLQGLEHHTLLVPKDFERGFEELYDHRQFPTAPIVYLNATTATDAGVAPPGCTNLFAVVTSPAKEPSIDWPAQQSMYRRRTLDVLSRFGFDIEGSPIDFERMQTPETFESRDGSYRGSLYGLDEPHRLWGIFPGRVKDEKYGNLLYAGGSVQPGAGMPMVVLSGMFAAGLV